MKTINVRGVLNRVSQLLNRGAERVELFAKVPVYSGIYRDLSWGRRSLGWVLSRWPEAQRRAAMEDLAGQIPGTLDVTVTSWGEGSEA